MASQAALGESKQGHMVPQGVSFSSDRTGKKKGPRDDGVIKLEVGLD